MVKKSCPTLFLALMQVSSAVTPYLLHRPSSKLCCRTSKVRISFCWIYAAKCKRLLPRKSFLVMSTPASTRIWKHWCDWTGLMQASIMGVIPLHCFTMVVWPPTGTSFASNSS